MGSTVGHGQKRTDLLVPKQESDVLVRFEGKRLVATGRQGEWVRLVGGALSKGEPHTFAKKTYTAVVTRHTLDGPLEAEVVVQRKPGGKFKVAAHGDTTSAVVRSVAEALGEPGSISEETQGDKPVARGVRKGHAPGGKSKSRAGIKVVALAPEEDDVAQPASAENTGPMIGGEEARQALKQTCTMIYLESGIKVRIIGKQKDAEAVCQKIIAGSPTLTTPKGSKYQIEGNLKKAYSEKSSGISPPNAQGVRIRDDAKERTYSAWGDNLGPVVAAAEAGCKAGTVYTVVIANRIVAAGTRKQN